LDENDGMLIKVMVLRWVSLVWIGSILLIASVILQYIVKRKENRAKI